MCQRPRMLKIPFSLDPDHEEATRMMDALTSHADELQQQASQIQLLGRYRDALQKISLAIETNPSVADYHVLSGSLHRRLGDFNAAIDDYLLALDKTDHNEESVSCEFESRHCHLTYTGSTDAWSTNTALDNSGTGLIIMCPMIIMYSMCGCFCTTSTNKIHY